MARIQPVPIARWDAARDVWIREHLEDTIPGFELLDVFSETFPTSGTTRAGTAYGQPTSAPLTDGSESSSQLPTPRATRGGSHTETVALLPSPAGGHERRGGARGDELLLNGVAKELALLPTPRVKNNENRQRDDFGGEDGNFYGLLHNPERWGDYAPAIARWERTLGRPAPEPTMTSTKGNPQLSPRFVEWLMGLPAGWVTDVPGLTRNEALKALGNGVVAQQCAKALRVMASWEAAA